MSDLLFESRLAPSSRKRAEVATPHGDADPTFCPSCGDPMGAALKDTPSVWIICEDCLNHPVPTTCATCNVIAPSTTREAKPEEIWICDECYERASRQPPPGMAWTIEGKEG